MCLYNTLIKNRKYTVTKKNGGVVPTPPDERVKYVPIGCGNCIECRKQRARAWQVRLLEEVREAKNGKFITLTFSNESFEELSKECKDIKGYELDNAIATIATRRFLERWRKKTGKSIRHWLVTELGHEGTENIHIHGIIWTNHSMKEIEKAWTYGYVWKGKRIIERTHKGTRETIINYVNEQTVNYIIKYINKLDEKHTTYKPRILTSAGIGRTYTTRTDSKQNRFNPIRGATNETYRTRTGHRINLPIYYRNKIYSEQEREQLWIQRLDKNERWVMGERVSTANGQRAYEQLLEYYQRRTSKQGWGNGQITWEAKIYEQQRRELLQAMRKTKTKKSQQKKTLLLKGEKYYTHDSLDKDIPYWIPTG